MEPEKQFSFCEDGDRPLIKKSPPTKFRPNEQVYVRVPGTTALEGPFKVSSVDKGRYQLCDEGGSPVKDNKWFEESELESYNPFR